MAALLVSSAFAEAKDPPILSIKRGGTYLYVHQEEHSEVVTELQQGEKLIALASALVRGEQWYLVKSQKGLMGWVRSSDVDGTDNIERIFRDNTPSPPLTSIPEVPHFPSTFSSGQPAAVPVRMTGSAIIVPVVLNGSLKSHMVMDTGATYTVVTPRIAKKLGLRLKNASRVRLMTANGHITAPLARLRSLKVGRAELHSLVVAVHEFSPAPQIEGLLGLNFLNHFDTSIDSGKRRLTLTPR